MPEITINVTEELIKEIIAASKKILVNKGLKDSDVINSLEWEYRENVFVLLAYDYLQFIDTGRRPRARKVPVLELVKWLKKMNIKPRYKQTYNSIAFAIQNSIYKTGIKGRQVIDPIMNVTLDILSEYIAEDLSESIADEIADQLTFTLPAN